MNTSGNRLIIPVLPSDRPDPIVLFRFHKNFDVCLQNLGLIRKLNPTVRIHGLYGGPGGTEAVAPSLAARFESLFALPFEDSYYNWMHGDICVRWWFKQLGHKLAFTHLCVAEWDMVYLRPLDEVYGGFPHDTNQNAISNTYENLLAEGWTWIQGRFQTAFDALAKEIYEEKQIDAKTLSYGLFGGCVLCRSFLEQLAQRVVRSYCNDEVRLAVYAALFDISVLDCGFLTDKRNIINADGEEYGEKEIKEVISRGGKIVHPVRVILPKIEELIGFAK